jgi:hypothetical protein
VSKKKQKRSTDNELKRNAKDKRNIASPENDMEISSENNTDKKCSKKKK